MRAGTIYQPLLGRSLRSAIEVLGLDHYGDTGDGFETRALLPDVDVRALLACSEGVHVHL